jgi:hypothetical protein
LSANTLNYIKTKRANNKSHVVIKYNKYRHFFLYFIDYIFDLSYDYYDCYDYVDNNEFVKILESTICHENNDYHCVSDIIDSLNDFFKFDRTLNAKTYMNKYIVITSHRRISWS